MAKTLFKADFHDKLPLGGIGTGYINLGADGSVLAEFFSFFAIKAQGAEKDADIRIMQSTRCEAVDLPCFEKSTAKSFFPFAEVSLYDSSFPANIKMTAFSPFIPLNDTDSGIPAVMFEFELTNTGAERIDYSIASVMQNKNSNAVNRMGCTDSGEAYILLSEDCEVPRNICTSTDGKNVSFCEYVSSVGDFISDFTKEATLINKTKLGCNSETFFGALSTHFSLEAGETKTICFCISWYNPKNEFSRNYYAQYFESSLECASYLFRQKDRIFGDSMEFCHYILGATLPENALKRINSDLFEFISKPFIRLDDGTLISSENATFRDLEGFMTRSGVTETLFPALKYSQTTHFYKTAAFEESKTEESLLAILDSYRKYILNADTDALIEDWYYIVKCAQKLFGEDGSEKCKGEPILVAAAVEALCTMAEAVRDKKRAELYSSMLNKLPAEQFSMDLADGFAKINEYSGFEYNAVERHIGFYPSSDLCPLDIGNTFRCFFCTPHGYGYVEEGIDYIEINLIKGQLSIRSFGVPRTPRLVQYGGRNWRFTDTSNCALLDSDLEITPRKKLTIFIDIKQ